MKEDSSIFVPPQVPVRSIAPVIWEAVVFVTGNLSYAIIAKAMPSLLAGVRSIVVTFSATMLICVFIAVRFGILKRSYRYAIAGRSLTILVVLVWLFLMYKTRYILEDIFTSMFG